VADLEAATAAVNFFKRYELINRASAANLKLVALTGDPEEDAATLKALPKCAHARPARATFTPAEQPLSYHCRRPARPPASLTGPPLGVQTARLSRAATARSRACRDPPQARQGGGHRRRWQRRQGGAGRAGAGRRHQRLAGEPSPHPTPPRPAPPRAAPVALPQPASAAWRGALLPRMPACLPAPRLLGCARVGTHPPALPDPTSAGGTGVHERERRGAKLGRRRAVRLLRAQARGASCWPAAGPPGPHRAAGGDWPGAGAALAHSWGAASLSALARP
jgi:hypothetical protein